MKEKTFFHRYSVLELERNGLYEYYLSKQDCGNLFFMYGTEVKCYPATATVLSYIKTALKINFWGA